MPKKSKHKLEYNDCGFVARSGLPASITKPSVVPSKERHARAHQEHCGRDARAHEQSRRGITATSEPRDAADTILLTGTIKKSQNDGCGKIDVQLQIPAKKLKEFNPTRNRKKDVGKQCLGRYSGPHVLILSILWMPFAFVGSIVMTFYVGTLCWYNIYLNLSEERTIWHKIFLCPLLLLSYPVIICVSVLAVSLFAAFKQISWHMSRWCAELRDFDKGFYGWICRKIGLPQCSPYEVIILDEEMEFKELTGVQEVPDRTTQYYSREQYSDVRVV